MRLSDPGIATGIGGRLAVDQDLDGVARSVTMLDIGSFGGNQADSCMHVML